MGVKKINILHLEDNETYASMIRSLLEFSGFNLDYIRVENEKDFLENLRNKKFDFILSDFTMPGFDGISGLRRAVAIQPDTPFIFLSGTLGEERAIELLKEGASDYVLKTNLKRLASVVRRALKEAMEKEEYKISQEALRKSEERYRYVMKATHDAVWDLDPATNELTWGDAIDRAFDYEIGGTTTFDWLREKIHPDEVGDTEKSFNKALAEGDNYWEREFRFRKPDGSYAYASSRCYIIRNDGRKAVRVVGVLTDITKSKENEQNIKSSLREKETMLKEIHHRVKNNLQIISSLLKMQSQQTNDKTVKDNFRSMQLRVRSMGLVHENLYTTDSLADIDMSHYIRNLVSEIFNTYLVKRGQIKLDVETGGVVLNIESAIPFGFILNELITNSIKHAFPAGRRGQILVELHTHGKANLLIYKDDGVGLPENVVPDSAETLGMQLITSLVEQLGGSLQIIRKAGLEYRFTFAESAYKPRLKADS